MQTLYSAAKVAVLAVALLGWAEIASAQSECWSGAEKSGAFCYPRCKAGYSGVGPVCWGACPLGYANDGATCRRDVQIFGANNDKCPIYDKCGLTLAKGCSTCPSGYKNDGCTCRRDVSIATRPSYGRGPGFLLRRDYQGIFQRYIRDHRNIWLPSALPLTSTEKSYLMRFFPRRLVDQVRIYDMAGQTGAFNFKADATTYGNDFIAVRRGRRTLNLLKHEFVHVCQYDRFGQDGFARRYADQFVDSGYNEQKSELERQAYSYQAMSDDATPPIKAVLGYCEAPLQGAVTSAAAAPKGTLMSPLIAGTAYRGSDYAEVKVASPNICAERCRAQALCRAMTYSLSSKTCWLKRSVPSADHGADFISATKQP